MTDGGTGVLGMGAWFANFTQKSWKNMNENRLAEVPSPYLEYGIYWTLKCAQTAAFIGGCILHPIYRLRLHQKLTPETRTNNSSKVIRNICRKMQGRCLLGGVALAPVFTLASIFINGYSRDDLREVCYRIRCDESIVYDRATVALGFVGWYWKRFQGAVDGINAAGLYTITYFNLLRDKTNVLLVDKMQVEKERRYSTQEMAQNSTSALIRFLHTYGMDPSTVREK